MIVENDKDLRALLRIGQICAQTMHYMLNKVEPGISTYELDQLGAAYLKKHGAQSAPITAYKFPGATCISLNDVVAHGTPSKDSIVQAGDMINIDVSAVLEGYWADTGFSMPVPPVNKSYQRLCKYTQLALEQGIKAAVAGVAVAEIGRAVQEVAKKGEYNLIPELGGHGVGRHIHEKPSVLNYYSKQSKYILHDGLVITIEPFLTPGKGRIYTDKSDNWSLRTFDKAVSAQFEHTIIINQNEPVIVTAFEG